MKAIQLAAPQQFTPIEIPTPSAPGAGQALVRTHRMGICGTDVSCYLGKFPFFDYPRIPGHELGVEVIQVGEGVDNVRPGDRCSVEPYLNCGKCFACRQGNSNCCRQLKVIGVMQDGGLCEQFLLPAHKLHPAQSLSYDQLALVETLAIGCRAAERGAPLAGEQVLIVGAGPIGLATLEFIQLTGARASVMDLSADRLEFVRQHYAVEATVQVDSELKFVDQLKTVTQGDLYPLVIDATGNPRSMAAGFQFLAATGTLVFVGITTEEIRFPHPDMHRPEATVKASRNALPRDFTRIIQLMETGKIDTDKWITHRLDFEQVPSGFEPLIQPDAGTVKAMINVSGS